MLSFFLIIDIKLNSLFWFKGYITKWKLGPRYIEISLLSTFLIFPLKATELKNFGSVSFLKIVDFVFEKTPSDTTR